MSEQPIELGLSLRASKAALQHEAEHKRHHVIAENWDGGVHLSCSRCTFRMMLRAEID